MRQYDAMIVFLFRIKTEMVFVVKHMSSISLIKGIRNSTKSLKHLKIALTGLSNSPL